MYNTPRTTEELIAMLKTAPEYIAAVVAGLEPDLLLAPPAPGEWSARDLLGHLRACSDMWGGYILRILNEDQPTIHAIDPTTWIQQTDYLRLAFSSSMEAYTSQRAGLQAVLAALAPEQWRRTATITGDERPRLCTVYDYALWLANHEHSHFKQLECTAAAVHNLPI